MERFGSFPGIDFSFSQLIRDNVQEALSGVKGANSVKVFGTDLKTLEATGDRVVAILKGVPGVENVGLFHIVGQPNFEIAIDRRACARYGINVEDVEEVVQVAIGGRAFSQMVEGEKLFDIVLRLPEDLRDDPASIARIPIDIPCDQRLGRPRPAVPGRRDPPAHRRRLGHLPREQPALPADQVQRLRPRPRLDHRRGPGPCRRRRPAAPRLLDRVVRRVRPDDRGLRPPHLDRPPLDRA